MADWTVHASSTAVFGRVLLDARNHHYVIDGPERNGCPGEALTPVESFLSGVVACSVELIQVIARETDTPLDSVEATIEGTIDREHLVRDDITVFSSVAIAVTLRGALTDDDGARLVAAFQARCPLYGTVRAATPDVSVVHTVAP